MMKGLFNYESAYREYTRQLLKDFVDDNIQYAEIRPNFMQANQLWTDDGWRQIDNVGIMQIIIDEYSNFPGREWRPFRRPQGHLLHAEVLLQRAGQIRTGRVPGVQEGVAAVDCRQVSVPPSFPFAPSGRRG